MADESGNSTWQPDTSLNGSLSVSAQLRHLRNLLDSDRQSAENQRGLETFDREMLLRNDMSERQRRDLETATQDRDVLLPPDMLPANSSPSSIVRSQRRAFRPSERLQRHRERYNQAVRSEPTDPLLSLPRMTPPPAFPETTDDNAVDQRNNSELRMRSKRRKLDDGTFEDETRIISYGDEGRVTPGPLKMEIIRCDGGDHPDSPTGSAQFVLQDDKNVYSTKENKCNILLKHIGGIPFSLTKMIIKAPGDGYTSPVQEGMVFVAMTEDNLLERTSQYDRYSPRSYRFHHPFRRHDYYRPSQEYLNSSRSPLRSIDRSRLPQDQQRPWSRHLENDPELETSLVPGFDITFIDPSEREGSPSYTPRSPVPWRDLDAEYSLRSYADRSRSNAGNNDNRDNASITSSESEDEYTYHENRNGTDNTDDLDEELARQRRYMNHMRMARERGEQDFFGLHPSRRARQEWRAMEPRITDPSLQRLISNRMSSRLSVPSMDVSNFHNSASSSKTAVEATSRTPVSISDGLAPHARFSMTGSQTTLAINFDPPVAGRYILIKLWSSCPASNIDVQCIIPHGYGGPRFFPSVEMR